MFRSILVFVVSLFLFVGNVYSEELKNVVAVGYGETHKEAIQDSLRNAVMKVVGSFVSATTIVSNGDLIKDKILTYSDGLVEGYKETATKREDGLFITELDVQVKVQELTKKLDGLNLIQVSFAIDKKAIEADIQADDFNADNMEELAAAFKSIIIDPFIKGKINNLKVLSKDLYKIKSVEKNYIKVQSISTKKVEKLIPGKWFKFSRKKTFEGFENKYLVKVEYTNRLSKQYINSAKRFLSKIANKTNIGEYPNKLSNLKLNKKRYISLVKMSHLVERGIITTAYEFDEDKFESIFKTPVRMHPYLEITLLDNDGFPLIKDTQKIQTGCSSGRKGDVIVCSESGVSEDIVRKFSNIASKSYGSGLDQYNFEILLGIAGNKDSNINLNSGGYGWNGRPNPKTLAFPIIDNDIVNFTTIFAINKVQALEVKDVQLKITFSELSEDQH